MNEQNELIALITGATDGIGKAVALELARNGYTVHVLGRNPERGANALNELNAISPEREHQLFLVDLAIIAANNQYLDEYVATYQKLDLLILNANVYTKEVAVTEDGIDKMFAVGYISRYLFTVKLNPLLEQAENPRVMHVGALSFSLPNIDYDAFTKPSSGTINAFKATARSYVGSALLTYFISKRTSIKAKHEFMDPGMVNTRQVKEQIAILRWLAQFSGLMEPEESARRIVSHILETDSLKTAGKFYKLEKEHKPKRQIVNGLSAYKELIEYSERVTGISIDELIES